MRRAYLIDATRRGIDHPADDAGRGGCYLVRSDGTPIGCP